MILSVSRRTDIPSFYSEWFFNRLKEGFALVRNPMNFRQVSRVSLDPSVIDCIVFWTKDPSKLLANLELLADYHYYFQITITGYEQIIEPNLPPTEEIVDSFKRLAEKIGTKRVIWRYDPIILTRDLDINFHMANFTSLAAALGGSSDRCVISFLDLYKKTAHKMKKFGTSTISKSAMEEVAGHLVKEANHYGLSLETCSEEIDLDSLGIRHGKCIDPELISEITGQRLDVPKDPNQRQACGCARSVDLGAYNTCLHGCMYCYANYNEKAVKKQSALHNPSSPLLVGDIEPNDKITDRRRTLS